jgi:hypothetical protein
MTEQEGYRKLAKNLEYLYIAETKRKARIWFHKHKENPPQRLEDYTAGVMLERDRIYQAIYKHFRGYDKFPNNPHKIGEAELMFLLKKEAQDD